MSPRNCVKSVSVRSGFTMIELLVAVAIVSLLLALLLPAIQQVRASARLATCRNNLKQVGAALHNACEANGAFPTGRIPVNGYVRMMPFLDATSLAEDLLSSKSPGSWVVPALRCPQDPIVWQTMQARGDASYYFNFGTLSALQTNKNGFYISEPKDLCPSDIQDGLSQTVAMSERLVSPETPEDAGAPERTPGRYFWWTETRRGVAEETLAVQDCEGRRTTTFPQVAGVDASGYSNYRGYTHLMLPNRAGCYNGPESSFVVGDMLIPASSLHTGGVSSLLADGSVHFVSDSIDREVWMALGSRANHEVFNNPFE